MCKAYRKKSINFILDIKDLNGENYHNFERPNVVKRSHFQINVQL